MICKWWMNDLAIANSCIAKYVYQALNKIINQSINQSNSRFLLAWQQIQYTFMI